MTPHDPLDKALAPDALDLPDCIKALEDIPEAVCRGDYAVPSIYPELSDGRLRSGTAPSKFEELSPDRRQALVFERIARREAAPDDTWRRTSLRWCEKTRHLLRDTFEDLGHFEEELRYHLKEQGIATPEKVIPSPRKILGRLGGEGSSVVWTQDGDDEPVMRIITEPATPTAPDNVVHLPTPTPSVLDVVEGELRKLLVMLRAAGLSTQDASGHIVAGAEDLHASLDVLKTTYQIRDASNLDVLDEIAADSPEMAGAIYAVEIGYPSLAALERARRVRLNVVEVSE